jgi:hypothetical protein
MEGGEIHRGRKGDMVAETHFAALITRKAFPKITVQDLPFP